MIGGIPLSKAGDIWSRFDHMVGSEFYIKIAVPGEISSVHNEAYPYVSQKQEFDKIVKFELQLYVYRYISPASSALTEKHKSVSADTIAIIIAVSLLNTKTPPLL